MSTTYSSYRRQPTTDQAHDKYRQKAQQLKELFPAWSTEGSSPCRYTRDTLNSPFFSPSSDLSSLLAEVNGELEVAATRISEGLPDTAPRSFLFTEFPLLKVKPNSGVPFTARRRKSIKTPSRTPKIATLPGTGLTPVAVDAVEADPVVDEVVFPEVVPPAVVARTDIERRPLVVPNRWTRRRGAQIMQTPPTSPPRMKASLGDPTQLPLIRYTTFLRLRAQRGGSLPQRGAWTRKPMVHRLRRYRRDHSPPFPDN